MEDSDCRFCSLFYAKIFLVKSICVCGRILLRISGGTVYFNYERKLKWRAYSHSYGKE